MALTVYEATSLGIQILSTLFQPGGPAGISGSRPIGMQRNPTNQNTFDFNPKILEIKGDAVDTMASTDLGKGPGVIAITYADDTYLRGSYILYVQVERI
jgi:hypothetical protein